MSGPKIVKRYANRKLYDTERSCYVTLDDISTMIRAGEEVRVVDNKTGEDLTSVTFAQIIFETEKKKSFMPLGLLRGLIQNGGEQISEFARGHVERLQATAESLKERATETTQKLKTELESKVAGPAAQLSKISELVQTSQKAIDDLQKGVEDKLKTTTGTVSRYATLGKDMEDIRERLAALEERLGSIK